MTENAKANGAISDLMALNGEFNESYICEWLTRLLKSGTVKSYLDLAENNYVWLELAELGKFKVIALEAPYFLNKNLQNYVKLIGSIWKSEKNVEVFAYFKKYLSDVFNPDFDFIENFESCIYSHTNEIVHIIVIATFLTCMMIFHNHGSEDSIEQLFEGIGDMDDETSAALKDEFKIMIELYDAIEEDFVEESVIKEPMHPTTPNNRTRGLTSVAEQHIAKKVEELQKTIDSLEAENEELKMKNSEISKELSNKTKVNEEQETVIKQLKYSRDDLLDKLKNKKFDMINEEIQDKQKEIDDLKEMLTNVDVKYQKRLREADESKDELAKKLHQMENYKVEFEKLRRANAEVQKKEVREGPSDEELQRLRDQMTRLQQTSLEDKQKCLNLEMQVSEISMQAQRLRLENQDLNYRVKELENDKSLGASEIYVDDFEAIREELSAAKHYKKLDHENGTFNDADITGDILDQIDKHGDQKISPFEANDLSEVKGKEYSQKRVEQLFNDYEKKCLHRIKMILKESQEYKSKMSEALQELEEMREQAEEQEEKVNNLESRAVENIVINSKELKELIYNVKNTERDSSEIAQDLLKNIVRKDLEIARLRSNRKRHQREALDIEASYTERISLLYEVIEGYISNL